MASRKEEKERLRRERLAAESAAQAAAKRRLMVAYAAAAVLGLIILGGVVYAVATGGGGGAGAGAGAADNSVNVNTKFGFLPPDVRVDDRTGTPPPEVQNGDLKGAARIAGCDLQLGLPDEGNTHFTNIDKTPDYKTNPPTSGDHFFAPNETGVGAVADGAFLDTPPFNRLVHSLEHGRVQIQYNPDLPEADQLAIKGVFDADRPGVQLFPNPDMPYAVAEVGWTNLVGCKSFAGAKTLDVLRAFRDTFRGAGPEAVSF